MKRRSPAPQTTKSKLAVQSAVNKYRDASTSDLRDAATLLTRSIRDSETEIARLRAELSKYAFRLRAEQEELQGVEIVLKAHAAL